MHENCKLIFEKHGCHFFSSKIRVLEIGPDQIPSTFQQIVNDSTIQWEYLDVSNPVIKKDSDSLTYLSESEYNFPIPSDKFDIVLSGNVIEHVRMIWKWMKEMARICKPEGIVITICPVSWPYHEAPVDCWRIYPEGMKALCEEAGLEPQISISECLEPMANFRKNRLYLAKLTLKAFLRQRYWLNRLRFHLVPTIDTILVARKPCAVDSP